MNPSIWIYGGVHDDPGSRQRFLDDLDRQKTAPHFVAAEWEQSVFERLVAWRPWVEEQLGSRWDFLTRQDCHELSLALAWEGDAYKECFPDIDRLWLEAGFQEADIKRRRGADADNYPKGCAWGLLQRLSNPCQPTMSEGISNTDPPPEPRSKKELIDRVWRTAWSEAWRVPGNLERDARWATEISKRCLGLHDGWVAVVVGWAHADPADENQHQRLRSLLSSKGLDVIPVRLGP